MIKKLNNAQKVDKKQGGFGIEILFPGNALNSSSDTGLGTIGRIDQATVQPGTLIPMHPHRDDEILTYLRSGRVNHKDSEGHSDLISNQRLMLMNAGSTFYHEELVLPDSEVLTALQIFMRPETSGLPPMVQFHNLEDVYSLNQWRAIAGKADTYPLQIRSSSWIYDLRLESGNEQTLPPLPVSGATCLLYVFGGEIMANETISLTTGESLLVEGESIRFSATQTSNIVLFVTDTHAPYSVAGMYSGNQKT